MSAEPSPSASAVLVTADNFTRVETDRTFAGIARQGGFGRFKHYRELSAIDDHIVQRANRDTLYSVGVFDLDAGPVTIVLPDAGQRFMTLMAIDEDHYVFTVTYGAGRNSLTRELVGTRYALVAIRTLVDPNDPKDVEQVHALQDAVEVIQPGGPGQLETPNWDEASHKTVSDALTVLGSTMPDWRHAAGRRGEVDPIRHLIVTATGWGLNPEKDALYVTVTPSLNDGKRVYRLHVNDVPVDGFWSVSVYNASGYFEPNDLGAYSFNNVTAKKADDGSVTIQFGGCDGKVANCLPITPGWNYTVRLYRPRPEILDGSWVFPAAQPAQ